MCMYAYKHTHTHTHTQTAQKNHRERNTERHVWFEKGKWVCLWPVISPKDGWK